jgi:hypothetical protein
MTPSSNVEMDARGRDPSTAPGRAANKLLGLVGVPELKGPPLNVHSDVTHWLYGTAWGLGSGCSSTWRGLPCRWPGR